MKIIINTDFIGNVEIKNISAHKVSGNLFKKILFFLIKKELLFYNKNIDSILIIKNGKDK